MQSSIIIPAASGAPAIPVVSPQPKPANVSRETLWYKDAIVYQMHVRAFRDSNGDGVGDFRGLTERLDYIQDLGVSAVWLLPFFPSPLRDDGYDIADYTNVNPQYGTLEDFQRFLEEAHNRDLRVITELVMNHTSDQHAWFQQSRRAKPGEQMRDWYVWSDTPDKYQEARIIFQDFEKSNWTWDAVAGAYFWHRFYSHQPDLNFDNPEVRQAMMEMVDYWLAMGVDGLRLDAVPYLYEREGTNCENLPETHAFLRDLRQHVDERFPNRMLLAEANQWPEDAAAYFGDGDECHMNFHFPLMPRLFMAVEREDRSPIIDILEQTPILPSSCQWAIFLRNHDELTLEMVTDEERDYMYRTYAVDAQARINLGIRRRLAPLMKNNRRKIELMNALLLSLPGTPIIYYGDEIGMGDNFYLGDRNGVRTPMQWSGDRNAGFSPANPQSLYLPVIIDPEYHYELRNVEVEQASPHSLLWWMRRILDLRKQYRAFGEGSFEPLACENPKVFAYLRETDDETLLVVANLSRYSQYAELDLSRFRGRTATELFGQTPFPAIGEGPYQLPLGPHGFYWFCIGCRAEIAGDEPPAELPRIPVSSDWRQAFKGRSRHALAEAIEPFLRRHRWFAGKARTIQATELIDVFEVTTDQLPTPMALALVRVHYTAGEPDAYVLPVMAAEGELAEATLRDHPGAGIGAIEIEADGRTLTLCEAVWEEGLWQELLGAIGERQELAGEHGVLSGLRTHAFTRLWDEEAVAAPPHVHGGEQSNTSAAFDHKFVMKLFRRVTPGVNPDFEIGRQLTEHAAMDHIPDVAGALEYRGQSGQRMTVAILHEFVKNQGDAWTYTLDELGRYFERVQAPCMEPSYTPARVAAGGEPVVRTSVEQAEGGMAGERQPAPPQRSPVELAALEPSPLAQRTVGGYLHDAELLGQRTAELHVALATVSQEPAFAPEPFTRLYQRSLYQSMRSQARSTLDLLRSQRSKLETGVRAQAEDLLQRQQELIARFQSLLVDRIDAQRIRCHGDFHLGQVLYTGKDFVIIDFEGEPERPVSERRIKASPLRDVAGMIRSLHYAAHAGLAGQSPALSGGHLAELRSWADFWYGWTSASFLKAYLAAATPGAFLPSNADHVRPLVEAYLMEKALYELRYELNNRPSWAGIPLEGILQLLDASSATE